MNASPIRAPRRELFELDLHGGVVERRFRARAPQVERMPWGTLDVSRLGADEVLAARRSWTDLALQEYAAAASQSNALRLVVRALAPLDLSAMLAGFPHDELVHTEVCARMAAELGGTTPIEYPTNQVFPDPVRGDERPLLGAAKTVVWEFCVAETLSLGMLKFQHRSATHPLLRAVWRRLAKDEALHARFGWLFLDWARGSLSSTERTEVAARATLAIAHVDQLDEKVGAQPEEAFVEVGTFGTCGRDAYLAQSRATLEMDVIPRLQSWA
jgi:hypothetical protein